jgi:hypothetical protein
VQYAKHVIKGIESLLSLAVKRDTYGALSETELEQVKSGISKGMLKEVAFKVQGSVVLEDVSNLSIDSCVFLVPDGKSMQPLLLRNCLGTQVRHSVYAMA